MIRSGRSVVQIYGWCLALVGCTWCSGIVECSWASTPQLVSILPAAEPEDGVSSRQEAPAAANEVFFLRTEFLPYEKTVDKGIEYRLGREIIRQAVLLSARDELGVATCDETLQETPPKTARLVRLTPIERADLGGKWNVRLIPADAGGKPWEKTYEYVALGDRMYADMIPKLEADSRGVMLDVLRGAGLVGSRPAGPAAPPPGLEIEDLLNRVDFISQFAAVRAAHQTIRRHGETTPWLGVLVRGYANLALLTQHHWNATTEVFTARAWLYAQRLMVVSQESAEARWHRAYAWALGGTLHHALADLDVLERLRAEGAGAAATEQSILAEPPWGAIVRAYSHCDRAALRRIEQEQPAIKPWAVRLRFQLASLYQEPRWMAETLPAIQDSCPAAYGVYADLFEYGTHATLIRMGAVWGPMSFRRHVLPGLTRIPDLPESLRQEVQSLRARQLAARGLSADTPDDQVDLDDSSELFSPIPMMLAAALRVEGERALTGDLSWSVLAYLLEEEQFVQVAHYVADSQSGTETSLGDEIDTLLQLVQNHRYAAYISAYRYNVLYQLGMTGDALEGIVIRDPRMRMYHMFWTLWNVRSAKGEIGQLAFQHAPRNFTLPGLMEVLRPSMSSDVPPDESAARMFVTELRLIAPEADCGTALELRWTPHGTAEQRATWEGQIKEDPRAWRLLAKHYQDAGSLEDALRCCRRSLELAPAVTTTVQLANLYWQAGDRVQWEQTLLHFLEIEDLGYEHGAVQTVLARAYAQRGEWQKAKPLAESFAETWHSPGLLLAGDICEGLAQWQESEEWFRIVSREYPSSCGLWWYFWCRRTGRGDLASAQELAQRYIAISTSPSRENLTAQGVFALLEEDPATALESYRRVWSLQTEFADAFMIAQVARQLGNEDLRQEVLNTMRTKCLEGGTRLADGDRSVQAAGLAVLQLLATGEATEEQLKQIDELVGATDASTRSAFAYHVAQELVALGKAAAAQTYFRRAVLLSGPEYMYPTLAGAELVRLQGTSRPDDDLLDANDLWPPLETAADK